ncbi:C-type lysozyme, inhibitor [Billgrantia endophytica]|uniref:C-type lysozyme, inhibitor n=2 Tax=Billgrantia endophytica TaxID=2033802 RepID=A0A2N7U246_9GAMM|nr:C-type lysozyme, inhibitor [Halomonas endophytica]
MLVLTGCVVAPMDGPGPTVSESASVTMPQVDSNGPQVTPPAAPLMPSLFFAGGADSFQAWRCTPAQDLVSVFTEDELRLWSAHGAYRLQPAVVASGARFQQGDLSFWSKGDEAMVESANGRLACQRDATRKTLSRQDRPGVMFHARGNEPGWVANLAHDAPELTLLMDYGSRELTLPYRVTEMDNALGRVTLASGEAEQPFELTLEARACFDDMSGEPFPARATLAIGGQVLRGCGQGIAP